MRWKISNLTNTNISQTLISIYPCLKKYNYICVDIKDNFGYIKGIEEYIELDDTIDEGRQLRELQEELNNSSLNNYSYKKLLLDFIKYSIIIIDGNIYTNRKDCNVIKTYSYPWYNNNSNI